MRAAFNQTWNVGYFFNCGSLDGDEVLRQLLIVIIACELVGIVIKLQMSNAGGANMKATAYLINNKCNQLPAGRPKVECVRYVNPMTPTRYILYTSPCSVHNLDNHRKQLCA